MSHPTTPGPRLAPMLVLAVSIGALAVALLAQYVGGLAPCALCLYQRYAYGAAILFAVIAFLLRDRPALLRLVVGLAGLALLTSAGIGVFHVGVEQHWWAGSSACGGALDPNLSLDELRAQIMNAPVVRCDEVAWSLFGLSMAGYNALYAGGFGLLVLWLALRRRPREGR
ncbi:disulfide bond formation protein B [Virgifigura deserti]|uniref:disulfide bond formation protein B n=1 Tax=Virgifigura deserti TaxID=2268457 RepID=UPI003CCC3BBC